jgi:outer membrane protein OmpA-like peptidoglycan-associated protein
VFFQSLIQSKKGISVIAVCLFFFNTTNSLKAQDADCGKPSSPQAIAYFKQAIAMYPKTHNYKNTKVLLDKALDEEPAYVDAYIVTGRIAMEKNAYDVMEPAYLKAIELCPAYDPEPYYELGFYYYGQGNDAKTVEYLSKLPQFSNIDSAKKKLADFILKKAAFKIECLSHPVPFNPVSVPGISTEADEYLPIISPDNELAFYTRRYSKERKGDLTPKTVEEFTMSTRGEDGVFEPGEKMPAPFNMNDNEGGATVSIDNNDLYFTICKKGTKGINCDIYTSHFHNGTWEPITNMGNNVNDPVAWDSQPSVSADGRTLYFASSRDGGFGNIDIYKTEKDSLGRWGKPINLGNTINTPGNDKSPFIHTDSRTLYFSSDSLVGVGGYDIFFSKPNENGVWAEPKNIGYPINSDADDLGFFASTDGKTGYFASNKLKENAGWDVFSFDLYAEARPDRVLFIKGELKDEKTGEPLGGTVELKNLKTNKKIKFDADSTTGKYVAAVAYTDDYILSVKKKGYGHTSKFIAANDENYNKPSTVDLQTKPIELGQAFVLNDIYFVTKDYALSDIAKEITDGLFEFLNENPTVSISINGHTDSVDDDANNLVLSENRAKSVYNYLIGKGIEPTRMKYKGYGETKPIAENTTESGRARNRRTEFVITGK